MSDPYVREVGRVTDMNGVTVRIGVDRGTVSIGMGHSAQLAHFTAAQTEQLAQAFVAATWQAAGYLGDERGCPEAEAAVRRD